MLNYFIITLKKISNFFLVSSQSKYFFFSIKIDIDEIKYFLELKNTLNRHNFLWGGNWDKKKIEITKYRKFNINYNSVFQIYKEGVHYKRSDEYLFKSKQIKNGKNISRVKNIHELNNYFLSLDRLKNSLKKKGYLSQSNLNDKRKNHKILKEKYGDDEIGVVIGRNGEIIKLENKYGGTHRFALCKVLKIKNIIVNVKAIHTDLLNPKDLSTILNTKNSKHLKLLVKDKLKLNVK